MIEIQNLSKAFWINEKPKVVADNMSLVLPTGRSIALLGRNGAGKSTLLQMIAGTMEPDSGSIISDGTISWPVGFGRSFHREMTGAQNVRFIARIYGVDTDQLVDFVSDFAELGDHFHTPIRTYSSGMKSRLAFGASMGIDFDTYLVDEVTAVGDANFRAKSRAVFGERMKKSGAVMVSHNMSEVRSYCDVAIVLDNGTLTYFEDLEEAIAHHTELMGL